MVEVGYRYHELYWAGHDQNWDYAQYQTQQIRSAMAYGFERRPARQASADTFMNIVLPLMDEAIQQQDRELFMNRFEQMVSTCNACHAAEDVGFMQVRVPTERFSSIMRQ